MRTGIKVGRIFGINIHIDWSWIFIFVLVTWNLAAAVFPALHPEWGIGLNIALGVAASLLFFISILLHELAHSLVARASGLPVRRIRLFIFGGVSNIEREPPSPLSEFLIAIVGPLTSILLGAAFLLLGSMSIDGITSGLNNPMQLLGTLDPLSTMLLWLGPINILIGLFNMVPGFPLDGGRILRSILWGIANNFLRATQWATLIGQGVGWLMILTGVAMVFGVTIPFLGTGLINGLWFAVIGWFLINAANQSFQRVLIEDMLEGVSIQRLMREPPPSVAPDLPISTLVYDRVMREDERAYPVMQNGDLLGMVYVEQIRDIERTEWDSTTVQQVMVPEAELVMANPRDDAMEAFQKLAREEVNQVPVMQNGTLVGILRQKDFMRWFRLHSEMAGRS